LKLYEYQAKEVLQSYGISVPKGKLIESVEDLRAALSEVGAKVALKSQVLAGGRGKAGGIKLTQNESEAEQSAAALFGLEIKGLPVRKILVEEQLDIETEYFIGITNDRDLGCPVVIASSEGGMSVEEVAQKVPQKIAAVPVDLTVGLAPYAAMDVLLQCGIDGKTARQILPLMLALYRAYRECDAELVEINPLVVTKDGRLVAADARLNIDDNALYRQPRFKAMKEQTAEDRIMEEARILYVDLGGNIGIMSTGAGMTMAVMDHVVAMGGRPANFMDCGIGMLDKAPKRGIELLVKRGVDAILISTYTGARSEIMAEKIIEAIESTPELNVPVVVRLQGLNQDQAETVLSNAACANLHTAKTLDDAVALAISLAGGAR